MKVLARGTFELPQADVHHSYATITPETLRLILSGVQLAFIKRRKRYEKAA